MANHPDKGVKGKRCNVTACQRPGAVWFNHSTRAYYCTTCARAINRANPPGNDSFMESLGHELCTIDEEARTIAGL